MTTNFVSHNNVSQDAFLFLFSQNQRVSQSYKFPSQHTINLQLHGLERAGFVLQQTTLSCLITTDIKANTQPHQRGVDKQTPHHTTMTFLLHTFSLRNAKNQITNSEVFCVCTSLSYGLLASAGTKPHQQQALFCVTYTDCV